MSLFLAEKGPGFTVSRKLEKLGLQGHRQRRTGVRRLPCAGGPADRRRRGPRPETRIVRPGTWPHQRPSRGIGSRRRRWTAPCVTRTAENLRQGRSLEHQAIQLKLADMATRTEAARLLPARRGRTVRPGRPLRHGSRHGQAVRHRGGTENVTEVMRVHGGYGYSNEFMVERLYRDAPLLVIGEGTSELQRIIIARQLVRGSRRDAGARGLRVLAVEQYGAGPYGSMQLAESGPRSSRSRTPPMVVTSAPVGPFSRASMTSISFRYLTLTSVRSPST